MLAYGKSKSAPIDRVSAGPFDSSEVIEIKPLVDFGALQIPIREDVTLKLEVEEASSRIVAGPELNAQIPTRDGGFRLAKFIGVDGPKWFLRGVISGLALADTLAMTYMIDIFRSVVVMRGTSPMPPKELLQLVAPAAAKKALS